MSTTDTSSRITYANAAFVSISGFDRDELIGQPHNIVRHPDMPEAAFEDMWATLQAGCTWTGLVKNRRKEGDYYWVRANVTPVRRRGELVGYMSVRTRPDRREIDAIAPVYARMRAPGRCPWALHGGILYRKGLAGLPGRLRLAGLGGRTIASLLLGASPAMAAVLVTAGGSAAAGVGVGLVLAGVLSGYAILNAQVLRPVRHALAAIRAVASGNTRDIGPVDRADEIGALLRGINQAGLNLASLLDDVQDQVAGLREAGGEVSITSSDLAVRTERAAASLEQTAASMEQFGATVAASARSAASAVSMAADATDVAREGGQTIEAVIAQMHEISASSHGIRDIIAVIDSIAFQTNILALNAAVEAARAGDQGRGFGVVAAEVRVLAQRSASAAKEIRGLIEASVRAVDGGSTLVDEAGRSIGRVIESVHEVGRLIGDIAQGAREQDATLGQVSVALGEIDATTQQNAALVEESSAAAESLHARSESLAQAVGAFRGSAGAPRSGSRPRR